MLSQRPLGGFSFDRKDEKENAQSFRKEDYTYISAALLLSY